jgi:hypothetical protein
VDSQTRRRKHEASRRYAESDHGKAAIEARKPIKLERRRLVMKELRRLKMKGYARKYNESPKGRVARGLPEPTRPMPAECENCGRPPDQFNLHVDHDHATGTFRGWLCRRCNLGIGLLGDDAAGALKAYNYLVRYGRQTV